MRRKTLCAAALAAAVAIAAAAWQLTATHAQPAPRPNDPPAGPAKGTDPRLPISHIVLFNSGVGYFERHGQVDGDARIDLTFDAADVNDLLKSLVLQDAGGGKVGGVHYDSNDPLDRVLRSFALDLTGNPTFGQILNQARGEKVEIVRQDKKGGQSFKVNGTIVGMQASMKLNWTGLGDSSWDAERLNLLTADGLLTIPSDEVLSVRFLNPTLESEFQRALRVVATSHDVQKKTVSVAFRGQGKRPVKVGYVVERPIWKTTYRLMLEKDNKAFLQGWAIVENPSDDDWKDVRLVLVAGRPISFKMNLYEPLYVPRPTVEPELFASLRPPVYTGGLDGTGPGGIPGGGGPPQMPQSGFGFPGGGGGFGGMGLPGGGFPGGQLGQQSQNPYQGLGPQNPMNPQQRLSYEELQKRREERAKQLAEAKEVGPRVTGIDFKEGIDSLASGGEVGDHYQYVIDQKVNLARQKSAMLPILNQHIQASKVSIYNASVNARHPLLGLRLKNTSGQPLTQGPITVYEEGAYAGDTRVLDLQANEERLVSYALDLATELRSESKAAPGPGMTFKIGDDRLTAAFTMRETTTYVVRNRSPHDRSLVVEHPARADWKLVSPAKPAERARDRYRFQVAVAAGQSARLEVVEEQPRVDTFTLVTGREPRYAVGNGVEVRTEVKTSAEELAGVRIARGVLHTSYRQRESKTYFVQNNSGDERTFRVDHIVRDGWRRLEPKGEGQRGPGVHRFTLTVPAGKTGHEVVVEERVWAALGRPLAGVGEERLLRGLLPDAATPAKVKAALKELLDSGAKLAQEQRKVNDLDKQLRILNEDQARLRENLKIVPPTSDAYKGFLQKFVAQEGEIERLRQDSRRLEAAVARQREGHEALANGLNVE